MPARTSLTVYCMKMLIHNIVFRLRRFIWLVPRAATAKLQTIAFISFAVEICVNGVTVRKGHACVGKAKMINFSLCPSAVARGGGGQCKQACVPFCCR